MSKLPPSGGARVRQVDAKRAGADRPVEMLAELGMVLTDPGHRLADRPGHPDTGARLLDVVLDLGEAAAVRGLRGRVEHLACIAECRMREAGRPAALDLRHAAALGGNEVQHVELPAGVGQEPREVPHPLEVSHSHRAPLKHNRPVIALATKAVDVRIRPVFVALDARFGAGGPRSFDPFENRAGRLVLRGGLVYPAAGSQGLGESDTGARRLIGCADLVPEARSLGAEPRPSAASPSAPARTRPSRGRAHAEPTG